MKIVMPSIVPVDSGTGGGWTCTRGLAAMVEAAYPGVRLEVTAVPYASGMARRVRQAVSLGRGMVGGLPPKVGYTVCPEVRAAVRTARETDLVLINGADLLWVLDELPSGTRTVVVAHNLEHELFGQQLRHWGALGRHWAARHREYEWAGLRRAGNVLFLSRRDWRVAQDALPGVRTAYLPPVFLYKGNAARPPFGEELHILLLSNFDWWPNREGVEWFFSEVWPAVKSRCHLHVVGPGSERVGRGQRGVTVHGYVADIQSVWRLAHVSIAPIRVGAGVKIKAAESIYNGLPVLTTGHATEGLASEEGLLVRNGAEEWISFLNGPAVWEWARWPVPAAAREAYALQRGTAELRKFLDGVQ